VTEAGKRDTAAFAGFRDIATQRQRQQKNNNNKTLAPLNIKVFLV